MTKVEPQPGSSTSPPIGSGLTQEALAEKADISVRYLQFVEAVRDLIVQVGERFLVRRASLRVLQTVARKAGVRLTQRAVGKGFSRWLPVAGAAGVAAYAYYDTARVATTAMELFAHEIDIETDPQ